MDYQKSIVTGDPADIRDETCTNLTILLALLMRNIKPDETVQVIATKRQLIQIEEVVTGHGILVHHTSLPEDLLVSFSKK